MRALSDDCRVDYKITAIIKPANGSEFAVVSAHRACVSPSHFCLFISISFYYIVLSLPITMFVFLTISICFTHFSMYFIYVVANPSYILLNKTILL